MGNELVKRFSSRWRIDGKFAKETEAELTTEFPDDPALNVKYAAMPVVREFVGGYRSARVVLLEGGEIVRKQYKMKHESGRRYFWHEVGMLHKLRECSNVPKLIHFDRNNGAIYMSFCGEPMMNSAEAQKRITKHLKEIQEKWGISHKGPFHPRFGGKTADNQPLNNVTTRNNRLYFIDFGSDGWFYTPPQNHNPPPLLHRNVPARSRLSAPDITKTKTTTPVAHSKSSTTIRSTKPDNTTEQVKPDHSDADKSTTKPVTNKQIHIKPSEPVNVSSAPKTNISPKPAEPKTESIKQAKATEPKHSAKVVAHEIAAKVATPKIAAKEAAPTTTAKGPGPKTTAKEAGPKTADKDPAPKTAAKNVGSKITAKEPCPKTTAPKTAAPKTSAKDAGPKTADKKTVKPAAKEAAKVERPRPVEKARDPKTTPSDASQKSGPIKPSNISTAGDAKAASPNSNIESNSRHGSKPVLKTRAAKTAPPDSKTAPADGASKMSAVSKLAAKEVKSTAHNTSTGTPTSSHEPNKAHGPKKSATGGFDPTAGKSSKIRADHTKSNVENGNAKDSHGVRVLESHASAAEIRVAVVENKRAETTRSTAAEPDVKPPGERGVEVQNEPVDSKETRTEDTEEANRNEETSSNKQVDAGAPESSNEGRVKREAERQEQDRDTAKTFEIATDDDDFVGKSTKRNDPGPKVVSSSSSVISSDVINTKPALIMDRTTTTSSKPSVVVITQRKRKRDRSVDSRVHPKTAEVAHGFTDTSTVTKPNSKDKPTSASDKPTTASDKPIAVNERTKDKSISASDKATAASDKATAAEDNPREASGKRIAASGQPTPAGDEPTVASDKPNATQEEQSAQDNLGASKRKGRNPKAADRPRSEPAEGRSVGRSEASDDPNGDSDADGVVGKRGRSHESDSDRDAKRNSNTEKAPETTPVKPHRPRGSSSRPRRTRIDKARPAPQLQTPTTTPTTTA
jgi:hypothetical protein